MQQMYLLTGENTFELRAELRRWISGFSEKHGSENCSRLSGSTCTLRTLLDEVAVLPFTATKRLVIVDGIPALERPDIEQLSTSMHPDVLLLIADPAPDRRLGGVKALLAACEVREFPALQGQRLQAWIQSESARHGAAFAAGAMEALLDMVGDDQEVLSQEIAKLSLWTGGRAIAIDDVRILAVSSGERNVWRLLDLLAMGNAKATLQFIRDLLDHGESSSSIWNILLWTIAQLTAVSAAYHEGSRTPQQIVARSGVKFGTVRSLLPLARRLTPDRLRACVSRFAAADIALKTGGIRSTAEAPEELEALTDVCIMELCAG